MAGSVSGSYLALQALWTKSARNYLYRRANLTHSARILDVGCSSADLSSEIAARTRGEVLAVDCDEESIARARDRFPAIRFCVADAKRLPFVSGAFDIALCHFLLMWVNEPVLAVREMSRVVRRGGFVIACAEPDYDGLVEEPADCALKEFLIESLRFEGADPTIGGKIAEIFREAGLTAQTGSLSKKLDSRELARSFDLRWELFGRVSSGRKEYAQRLKSREWRALQAGVRTFMLPVFWAFARKE